MHALTESLQPILQAHARLIPALRQLCDSVHDEAYLVGGCIRDMLLGRPVTDIDLTIHGDGIQGARQLADAVRSPFIPLDEKERTGRVVIKRKWTIDITSLKGKTLHQDLARRDFTINAIAAGLSETLNQNPILIDPLNGIGDLQDKQLKATSEAAFVDDPIRLLRAFRFAAQLDLTMSRDTMHWMTRSVHRLPAMSSERILEEMAIFLSQRKTANWMSAMQDMGLIHALFPAWQTSDEDAPLAYPLLAQIDLFLDQPDGLSHIHIKHKLTAKQNQIMAGHRLWPWVLRLAAVLLSQPLIRHENYIVHVQSADQRLRLSKREYRTLHRLTGISLQLIEALKNEPVTDDHLFEMAYKGEEDIVGVVLLVWAMHKRYLPDRHDLLPVLDRLLWLQDRCRIVHQHALLVTGTDIIQTYQLKPGPQVGQLLGRLEKDQILDKIKTRSEAFHAIETWLSSSENA